MQLWDASGNAPLPARRVPEQLARDGLVLLRHAEPAGVRRLLDDWTEMFPHPHDETPGLTVVAPRGDREPGDAASDAASEGGSRDPGTAGFTSAALGPHTDRSLSVQPPSLLASVLLSAADEGGDALLADGTDVLATLHRSVSPAVVPRLRMQTPHGATVPVVTLRGELVQLRYRDDDVAAPAADLLPPANGAQPAPDAATALRAAVTATTRTLPLRSGDGYILHNHRYLHGRTSFRGDRRLVRLLATVTHDGLDWLNQGFR